MSRDAINRAIAGAESADWDAFMQSVEQRKKERGLQK